VTHSTRISLFVWWVWRLLIHSIHSNHWLRFDDSFLFPFFFQIEHNRTTYSTTQWYGTTWHYSTSSHLHRIIDFPITTIMHTHTTYSTTVLQYHIGWTMDDGRWMGIVLWYISDISERTRTLLGWDDTVYEINGGGRRVTTSRRVAFTHGRLVNT
jgi:hypothetical protein